MAPLKPQESARGFSTVAAQRFPRLFGRANRAASSKPPRFFRHRRRFGAFPLTPELPMFLFQQLYVSVYLLNDLTCFSFRSAAAAVLVRTAVKNFSRNPTAERQRPQGASQIESGNKKLHALLCAARAASALQRRAMAGQGRSPCGLGESKGGHSSAKNGPLSLCAARVRRGFGSAAARKENRPGKMHAELHGGGHQKPAVRPTYK